MVPADRTLRPRDRNEGGRGNADIMRGNSKPCKCPTAKVDVDHLLLYSSGYRGCSTSVCADSWIDEYAHGASVVDLKFLRLLPRARKGTSDPKTTLETYICQCPLDSEVRIRGAARDCERRNRDTRPNRHATWIGAVNLSRLQNQRSENEPAETD